MLDRVSVKNRCTSQHDPRTGPCAHCAIRSLAICSVLQDTELDALEAIVTPIVREPGQAVVHEGDRSSHVFNITAGVIKAFKHLPDGRRQITGFLFEADFLGLAVGDEGYTYGAEAVTKAELCQIRRTDFEALFDRFPKLERRLLALARDELAIAQEKMLLLGRMDALERVATFLVGLADRAARFDMPATDVVLPMTRTDIADYLGLTLETVSRTFSRLRNSGSIASVGRQDIRINNIAALRDLAGATG